MSLVEFVDFIGFIKAGLEKVIAVIFIGYFALT